MVVAEGQLHMDRALAETCNNQGHTRQAAPGPPAARRSTGQDTSSGHCTVSDRRTAFGRHTACDRRIASCHRTASGLRNVAGPEGGNWKQSARPAEQDNRSGSEVLEANSSDQTGISGLSGSPDPGTVGPVDRRGLDPEGEMASRAAACRLQLPEVDAFDPHPRWEGDSANLRGCLAEDPLSLSDIRLTY